jgi:two-component system, NarL family, nitrate/nitrite response regulator NarL
MHSVPLMIDVLLADPQVLFRDGVARAIRQDPELRLVAEAEDGRTALIEIGRRSPAVAVVARELGTLDGDSVVAAVTRDGLATRVLIVDTAPGAGTWRLLGDGAAGVVSRRVSHDALRAAVHHAAQGGVVLCEEAQAAVAGEIRLRQVGDRPLLSPREQEILKLEAAGLSAPEIGRRLHLATSTVRSHHKHLLEKLEARDRAQLICHAMRRKLIE